MTVHVTLETQALLQDIKHPDDVAVRQLCNQAATETYRQLGTKIYHAIWDIIDANKADPSQALGKVIDYIVPASEALMREQVRVVHPNQAYVDKPVFVPAESPEPPPAEPAQVEAKPTTPLTAAESELATWLRRDAQQNPLLWKKGISPGTGKFRFTRQLANGKTLIVTSTDLFVQQTGKVHQKLPLRGIVWHYLMDQHERIKATAAMAQATAKLKQLLAELKKG